VLAVSTYLPKYVLSTKTYLVRTKYMIKKSSTW